MGGIAGFSTKKDKYDLESLETMLDKIKHRGPDLLKTYYKDNVYLGQAYLSQSNISLNDYYRRYKNYIISFDGAILNRYELISMIGIEVGNNAIPDEKIIMLAYEKWGEDCLSYFRGMWAFVIYDTKRNVFFGSRDRFGIKPLYYYFDEESIFSFSSEIKPLITLQDIEVKPNLSVVSTYLVTNLMNYSSDTFFKGIHQLEPANYFVYNIKETKLTIKKYYDLKSKCIKQGEVSQKKFESILDKTFLIHGTSDEPIGTLLSGGLDSSTITAMVSTINNKYELHPITAKSELSTNDESEYAKIVSNHLNLDLNIVIPTYEEFKTEIERALYIQEEPVGGPSVFMQYSVLKRAKDLNLRVILDGQGGDEILLGYERYYAFYLFDLLKKGAFYKVLKEYRDIIKNSKLNSKDLLKYLFYFNSTALRERHLSARHPTMKEEYLRLGLKVLSKQSLNKGLLEMQISEITKTNMRTLLKVADRNAMAMSIESRFPFIDYKVIESALSIKPENKIQNGYTKFNLRKYLDGKLPDSIVWRKNKMGFEAPTNSWINKHQCIIREEIENSKIIKAIFTDIPDITKVSMKETWKLYNIAVWERQYFN